jgi:hypothetical protein
MKNYLYSILPEVWQVVCDGVEFPDEDEQPTVDQLQKIHCNAQAISILTSSIDKEEFNRVDGLDVAKDVWNTLWIAHEGSRPIRKAKVKMLEGQLNRFIKKLNKFIKKLNKFIKKRRSYKREKKEKLRSKRVCYNCGKNGHFIAQCPYERKEEDNFKIKKFDKGYKKYTKKKPYGQALRSYEESWI